MNVITAVLALGNNFPLPYSQLSHSMFNDYKHYYHYTATATITEADYLSSSAATAAADTAVVLVENSNALICKPVNIV